MSEKSTEEIKVDSLRKSLEPIVQMMMLARGWFAADRVIARRS